MAICLIGLGSNLGDRDHWLRSALQQLGELPQTQLSRASSFHGTDPAGGPALQGEFLNAVARIETGLAPEILLTELQSIERSLGRVRKEHWGPRTIDLDLLIYDQLELATPQLILPHPRMAFRRFVLEPASEVAADMIYPLNQWTIARLLSHLNSSNREILLVSGESDSAEQLLRAVGVQAERDGWQVSASWSLSELCLRVAEPPKLIVVWQPASTPELELLDQFRHSPQCGPVLWIPGVSLLEATQEVFAAMTAMG